MNQLLAQNTQELGSWTGDGFFLNPQRITDAESLGELFSNLASTIFGFLTIVAGLAFLLFFVLGAISWVTSGGDKGQIEKARNQMTNAAIGLIAVVAAYTIAGIVSIVLGINILDPGDGLQQIEDNTTMGQGSN